MPKDAWTSAKARKEAITRSGQGKRFFAAVSGLEYTFYGIFESKTDLGVLVEYLYDGRDNATAPASFIDKDVFIGVRLVLNDTQDTTFLAGTIVDRNARAIFLNVEAERRLGEHWKLEIKGRFFNNVPDNNPLAGIRRDDFISLRLGRYFK